MNKYMTGLWGILTGGLLLLATGGCGYHIGFIKHPQLNSIAVAPAVNETATYNAASDARMMMCEVVMQDGTFELSDQHNADAILYMVVKEVAFASVSDASIENDNQYKPSEWRTKVTVDYKLVIPGQGEPLRAGTVSGDARFQAPLDVEGSRLRAVRQACYEASRQIIYNIAEGW